MRAGDVEDENPNRTIWIVVVGAGERDVEIALRAGLRGLCGERNGRDQQAEQQPHLSVESQKVVGIRPRMLPAGWGCHCSNIPDILPLRALPSGRLAALGAQRTSKTRHS